MKIASLCALALIALSIQPAAAEKSDWAEGSDGANREHYNRAAQLPWKNFMGDWRDAKDVEQGDSAYAIAGVADTDSQEPVEWDVSALVKEWTSGKFPNQGMFLRVVEGRGPIVFGSRESANSELHPRLILVGKDGTAKLAPTADSYLTKSTYRSQGQAEELRVSAAPDHLLIRFDLSEAEVGKISEAKLVLQSTKQFGGGAKIGVFRSRHGHDEPPSEPIAGIAARYPNDQGIADDPEVIFATGFESADWRDEWTQAGPLDKIAVVGPDTNFKKFEQLQGRALQSRIAKGELTALNTLYKFAKETGEEEPEQIYFRYYLRLADDWNQTVQGGKLPGISGTYGRAGWGGRKSDGRNGWSARGLFKMTIPEGNPLAGTTPVGFYCYHADMKGSYGANWVWSRGYRGYLETNRWYAIEQFCRLNTPGEADGILRAWVDGRLAFEKTDIRFRLTEELRIEQIWMNLYHGGTTPSPYDQHIFIDNVVIATSYIGPKSP